jgi:hypothetical protein
MVLNQVADSKHIASGAIISIRSRITYLQGFRSFLQVKVNEAEGPPVQQAIGIHDYEGIIPSRFQSIKTPCQRISFPQPALILSDKAFRAEGLGDLSSSIGAIVGHNPHIEHVQRVFRLETRPNRVTDRILLVVSWNKDDEIIDGALEFSTDCPAGE